MVKKNEPSSSSSSQLCLLATCIFRQASWIGLAWHENNTHANKIHNIPIQHHTQYTHCMSDSAAFALYITATGISRKMYLKKMLLVSFHEDEGPLFLKE